MTLPSDPLQALGSSLFFSVLEHLPSATIARLPIVCKDWRDFCRANESGIWRSACRRSGVDAKRVEALLDIERSDRFRSARKQVDWKALGKEYGIPEQNWRNGRCSGRKLDIDRRPSVVDNFQIDEEQNTCIISLTQAGGIAVIDLKTLRTLVTLRGGEYDRSYDAVKLAFCEGFLIIKTVGKLGSFHIYRTQSAISRSKHPLPIAEPLLIDRTAWYLNREYRRSFELRYDFPLDDATHASAHLSISGASRRSRPRKLPRGGLALYGEIHPPGYWCQFRARVDHRGSGRERVVLGMLGVKSAHFFHLEEPDEIPETIEFPQVSCGDHTDFDFSDNHLFICAKSQIQILSRVTKNHLFCFSPITPTIDRAPYGLTYLVDSTDDSTVDPMTAPIVLNDSSDEEYEAVHDKMDIFRPKYRHKKDMARRRVVKGMRSAVDLVATDSEASEDDEAIPSRRDVRRSRSENDSPSSSRPGSDVRLDAAESVIGVGSQMSDHSDTHVRSYYAYDDEESEEDYNIPKLLFNSCRLSDKHLICTTENGKLLVVQNYEAILAIPDQDERLASWERQTIIINVGSAIKDLSVTGTKVACSTPTHLIFFDTSTLPSLPYKDVGQPVPPIRVHSARRPSDPGIVESFNNVQVHRCAVYCTYLAYDPSNKVQGVPVCIRTLEFGQGK